MKKSVFKIALTLLLAFIIGFASIPVHTYAANNTTDAAKQKKIAKKLTKDIRKRLINADTLIWSVSYKKTGKRYTITITETTTTMDMTTINETKGNNIDAYQSILRSMSQISKNYYKAAKKLGLKKPIVRAIWKSSDGQTVVSFKNGTME